MLDLGHCCNHIGCVYKTTLRIAIQNNLCWDIQVNNMISRASRRLFMLYVLRKYAAPVEDMLTIFQTYIRPILEYACAVWHPGLTKQQSYQIERIQKRSCKIMNPLSTLSTSPVLPTVGTIWFWSLVSRSSTLRGIAIFFRWKDPLVIIFVMQTNFLCPCARPVDTKIQPYHTSSRSSIVLSNNLFSMT